MLFITLNNKMFDLFNVRIVANVQCWIFMHKLFRLFYECFVLYIASLPWTLTALWIVGRFVVHSAQLCSTKPFATYHLSYCWITHTPRNTGNRWQLPIVALEWDCPIEMRSAVLCVNSLNIFKLNQFTTANCSND